MVRTSRRGCVCQKQNVQLKDIHPQSVIVCNHTARLAPRVTQELQTLVEECNDVTVFLWERGESPDNTADGLWAERRLRTNAPVGWFGASLYLPWLYLRLIAVLWQQDVDIVHFTHALFLPLAPLARGFGCKTVYDSYEFHALDIALRFPESIQLFIEQGLIRAENTLVRTVSCVLTIDSTNDRLSRRYSNVCDCVTVLYNVPHIIKERRIEKIDNCDESYQLVYVGGISIEKGAVQAIKTVGMLREAGYPVSLHFIGTIQGGESWFWTAIRDAGVIDSIEHTAWLPYESMLEHIIGADVALALHQPTERFQRVSTGNGRKFFTYMQAGIPIVGPEFGEVGQAIVKTDCGQLVDTTDTKVVSDVISELLDAPNQRIEMGKRGRRAIEEQFNWNIEKRKLITAYQQCINRR